MTLPNAKRAFVDDRKLVEYCLNFQNPIGKDKARVFRAALGITSEIYFVLKNAILDAVLYENAEFKRETPYGKLWTVDFEMTYLSQSEIVRTGWIVQNEEDFPRLTTCFILKNARK